MSVIGSNILAGASGQGGVYTIDRSLRFRSSASAYLNRTPASAGNRQKFTFSFWVKPSTTTAMRLFSNSGTAYHYSYMSNPGTNTIVFSEWNGSSFDYNLQTTAVYRDPAAWYHIVFAVDTTQATASNRILIYVNGVQVTSFATATYPTQNFNSQFNNTNNQYIGRDNSAVYADGYLTDVNFIDGQALDPTSFGEYNSDTGVWQPKKYGGAYGTNGFYLNFSDNSTTTTLGYDTSGNGNNWTANNISVTSGVTYDSMTDVPTLTSEDAGNFATLNPLDIEAGSNTFSNGNLSATTGTFTAALASIQISSGKWYWEVTANLAAGTPQIGIAKSPIGTISTNSLGQSANAYLYVSNGNKANNNSFTAYGATYTTNDVIGVALDLDAGTLVFYKNGASQGTAFSSLSGSFRAAFANCPAITHINFGQRPFAYTPPAGFKSLNTYNLTDSTIEDGSKYFDAVLWTGDGSETRSITDTNFQPDMVWMKLRTGTTQVTQVYDSVRGVGGGKGLSTAEAYAEGTMNGGYLDSDYGYISSLDASGFSVNDGAVATTGGWVNYASRPYVAWNWKASSSGVTNNEGTIESTVSANTTAGFSVATFTGNGTPGATVGHGLNVAPSLVIAKSTNNATNWYVYHSALGGTKGLILNVTNGASTSSVYWNNTNTSSTVVTFGVGDPNNSGSTSVMYCFADVEGYSKFGSFTGNGDPNGPFSYLGFRPAFVMIKSTGVGTRWIIWDAARDTYNVADKTLAPNFNATEFVNPPYWYVDLLSNGFKVRGYQSGDTEHNYPGSTYIYMAFAENPFKNSLAR